MTIRCPFARGSAALFAALILTAPAGLVAQDSSGNEIPGSAASEPTAVGPHGGSVKRLGTLGVETWVEPSGIFVHLVDSRNQPRDAAAGRGVVSLRVEDHPKLYRYDLLPDGEGGFAARVNLSKVTGRQLNLEVRLIGLPKEVATEKLQYREVVTVPLSDAELAAEAIARQKVCPVSGKPLGSMGDPLAVQLDDQTLYVCCAGCTEPLKENPAKYAGGQPEVKIAKTTAADAPLIAAQKVCPVMDEPLGSMGGPVKLLVGARPIFLCCKGCIKKVKAKPNTYLARVYGEESGSAVPRGGEEVRTGVFRVSKADQPFIGKQKQCPVMEEPLDAMGGPYRVEVEDRAIYICCPGCAKRIQADPQKYLAVLEQQGVTAPRLK